MAQISRNQTAGRKQIKLTADSMGQCLTQDLIWQLVRDLREFNVEHLIIASANYLGSRSNAFRRRTVQEYVHRLTKAGYLEKTLVRKHGCSQLCSWKLVHDIGAHAPRLTSDGKPSRLGIIREHIWQAIKVIGEFNCIELAATASTEDVRVTPETARPYIRMLCQVGYLVQVRAPGPRVSARYRKVERRCRGKAPVILNTQEVFDRNLLKVMEPITG